MTDPSGTGLPHPPGREPGEGVASAQFLQFLEMVGPEAAERVLRHFQDDLAACDLGLAEATIGPDWQAIRNRSHVLIALAGTIGATDLHRMAVDLNGMAHHPPANSAEAMALVAQIRLALTDVGAAVKRLLANRGQAA